MTNEPRLLTDDTLRLVDCARCGAELLGEQTADLLDRGLLVRQRAQRVPTRTVAGRLYDRPYCGWCLDLIREATGAEIDAGRGPGF